MSYNSMAFSPSPTRPSWAATRSPPPPARAGAAREPPAGAGLAAESARLAVENDVLLEAVTSADQRGADALHRNRVLMDEVQSAHRGLAAAAEENAVATKEKDMLQESNRLMLEKIQKLEELTASQDVTKQREMTGVLTELRNLKTQLSSDNDRLKKHLQAKQEAIYDLENVLRNPNMSPAGPGGRLASSASGLPSSGASPTAAFSIDEQVVEVRDGVEKRVRFLENVNRTLKTDNESLNRTLDQLNESVFALRASKMDDLKEIEALTLDVQNGKQQLVDLKASCGTMEAERDAAVEALAAAAQDHDRRAALLEEERAAAKAQKAALDRDMMELKQTIAAERATHLGREDELSRLLAQEQRRVGQFQRVEGTLRAELEMVGGDTSSAAMQWRQEAQYVSEQLKQERSALEDEVRALKEKVNQDASTAGLRGKLVALQAAHSALLRQVSEAASKPLRADAAPEALAAQLDAATASNLALSHEVDFLRQQLLRWEAGDEPPRCVVTAGGDAAYPSPSLRHLSPRAPETPSRGDAAPAATPSPVMVDSGIPPLPIGDALGLISNGASAKAGDAHGRDREVAALKEQVRGLSVERAALEAEVWKQRQRTQSQMEAREGSEDASATLMTEVQAGAARLRRFEAVEVPALQHRIEVLETRVKAERSEAHAQKVLYTAEKEQRAAAEELRRETEQQLTDARAALDAEIARYAEEQRAAKEDGIIPNDQRTHLHELLTIEKRRREDREADVARLKAELVMMATTTTLRTSPTATPERAAADKHERALREKLERDLATQKALTDEAVASRQLVQVRVDHLSAQLEEAKAAAQDASESTALLDARRTAEEQAQDFAAGKAREDALAADRRALQGEVEALTAQLAAAAAEAEARRGAPSPRALMRERDDARAAVKHVEQQLEAAVQAKTKLEALAQENAALAAEVEELKKEKEHNKASKEGKSPFLSPVSPGATGEPVPRIARESSATTATKLQGSFADEEVVIGRYDSDAHSADAFGLLQEIEKINAEKLALQAQVEALRAQGGAPDLSELLLVKSDLQHMTQDLRDYKAQVKALEQSNTRLIDDNSLLKRQLRRDTNRTPVGTAEEVSRLEGLLHKSESMMFEAEDAGSKWKDIAMEIRFQNMDLKKALDDAKDEAQSLRAVLDEVLITTPGGTPPRDVSTPQTSSRPSRTKASAKRHRLELWQAQCLVEGWKLEMARFFRRYKHARGALRAFETQSMALEDELAGGGPRTASRGEQAGGPTPFSTAVTTSLAWLCVLAVGSAAVVMYCDVTDPAVADGFLAAQRTLRGLAGDTTAAVRTALDSFPGAGDVPMTEAGDE